MITETSIIYIGAFLYATVFDYRVGHRQCIMGGNQLYTAVRSQCETFHDRIIPPPLQLMKPSYYVETNETSFLTKAMESYHHEKLSV